MPKNKLFTSGLYSLIFLAIFFLAANLTSQVFFRGETVIVPDVVGKTFNGAKEELSKARIAMVLAGTQYSGDQERGKVLSQEPPAGQRMKAFKSVKVVLSKGSETVTVPKVVGLTLETVGQSLIEAGLRKGAVTLVHTPRLSAGRIMLQFPQAENPAFRDSTVNILVSQGEREEKYLMPDLLSQRGESVRKALTSMGFRLAVSGSAYYPGLEPGLIIRQFPPRGFPVQKTTLISVEVSK
jgi:eukaryotic-like serine/threonine-protein kinase